MADRDPEILPPRLNPDLIGHEAAEKDYLGAWSGGRLASRLADRRPARHRQGDAGVPHGAVFALTQGGEPAPNDMFGGAAAAHVACR